jgi:transcriptional regulator with XRE-family HTH domain
MPDRQLVELDVDSPEFAELFNQAIGSELRLTREENGWSREQFATSSHFDNDKIQSVEDGESSLTVFQHFNLCKALGADPIDHLTKSMQRRGIWLKVSVLQVSLTKVLDHKSLAYTWLRTWARSQQASHSGWITLNQNEVKELAKANGCEWRELLTHLITFIPDERASFEQYLKERNKRLNPERRHDMNEC